MPWSDVVMSRPPPPPPMTFPPTSNYTVDVAADPPPNPLPPPTVQRPHPRLAVEAMDDNSVDELARSKTKSAFLNVAVPWRDVVATDGNVVGVVVPVVVARTTGENLPLLPDTAPPAPPPPVEDGGAGDITSAKEFVDVCLSIL